MIDEKNPRQNSDNDDSSDDEIIIDLTEEIDTKPKEDNSILKLTEEMDTDDPLSLVRDGAPETDNDEKFFSFDENDESESAEDDAERDLTARLADAQEDPVEDQLIASAMDYSLAANQDEDREITEEFDLSADENDDILTMDAAGDETEENFSIIDGGNIAENQKDKSLFDLEEDISLDYEFDNDEEDIIDLDDTGREEENQNFANLLLADSKKSDQEDEDTDEFPEEDEEFKALSEEKPLYLEGDDDLLGLDANADLEYDFETRTIDGLNGVDAENDKEIIEITEFDQHFPADGEALLKQSGMLDSTPEDDVLKTIFDGAPKTDSGFENEILEAAAEAVKSERTPKAGTDFSKEEEFEINLDAGAVAKQVDRLDTFLFKDSPDEPVLTALDADRPETKKTGPEDSQAAPEIDLPLALSPGQIDAAIERVISEKFSDKIEDIIYEVIEKAVSKEINRLKNSLIGNHSIDDDQT